MQSETIGKLTAALAKAQGKMPAPKKTRTATVQTKTGGKYIYRYADVADVLECAKPGLAAEGIAFTQHTYITEAGSLVLRTVLMHQGEWIASEYPLPLNVPPQEMGSLLTYHRRYQLCGLVGIAAEDDNDCNVASPARSDSPPQRATASRSAPVSDLPEWKRDAESIRDQIKAAIRPGEVDNIMDKNHDALETIRENSKTAYDFLITAESGKKMELMKAELEMKVKEAIE